MDNGYKSFSERYGHTTPKMPQREDMDDDLRGALWNAFMYVSHQTYMQTLIEKMVTGPQMVASLCLLEWGIHSGALTPIHGVGWAISLCAVGKG